jgi:hypothetical protein
MRQAGETVMREHGPVPHHNLFRRKDSPSLFCAVPESRPVPLFIRTPAWEFAGKMDHAQPVPGFRDRAARLSMQQHGFYAFDATS